MRVRIIAPELHQPEFLGQIGEVRATRASKWGEDAHVFVTLDGREYDAWLRLDGPYPQVEIVDCYV